MKKYLKAMSLPFLTAFTPILFLYRHNVRVLYISNIMSPLLIATVSVLVFFAILFFIYRNSLSASFYVVLLVIANYLYGFVYYFILRKVIHIPVEHHILLPLTLLCAFFTAYIFNRISTNIRKLIHEILLIITLLLAGYNTISIIIAEIQKVNIISSHQSLSYLTDISPDSSKSYPDVYYIFLDEYAGFDVIREYWHEDYVNSFEDFLIANNFIILENSRSLTSATILELASRLNLKQYPMDTDLLFIYLEIIDNKVMKIFKSYGYKTIAFHGPYPPYNADYNFDYRQGTLKNQGIGTDEFREFLLDNSMFSAFSELFQSRSSSLDTLNSITSIFQKTSELSYIQSPKFILSHILFPHPPFVVDKDGNVLGPEYQYDWNYYLGQHQYSTEQTQSLISRLLDTADPEKPPVIIIQSDHGARNSKNQNGVNLEDYPQDFQYHILSAMYLPGFEISRLSNDISPIDTFAIVLNHYLNANVEVEDLVNEK